MVKILWESGEYGLDNHCEFVNPDAWFKMAGCHGSNEDFLGIELQLRFDSIPQIFPDFVSIGAHTIVTEEFKSCIDAKFKDFVSFKEIGVWYRGAYNTDFVKSLYLLQVHNKYDCINWGESELETSSSGSVQFVDKLVLSEDKIGAAALFSLERFNTIICIVDEVVAAITNCNLKNIKLLDPSELWL